MEIACPLFFSDYSLWFIYTGSNSLLASTGQGRSDIMNTKQSLQFSFLSGKILTFFLLALQKYAFSCDGQHNVNENGRMGNGKGIVELLWSCKFPRHWTIYFQW